MYTSRKLATTFRQTKDFILLPAQISLPMLQHGVHGQATVRTGRFILDLLHLICHLHPMHRSTMKT